MIQISKTSFHGYSDFRDYLVSVTWCDDLGIQK